MAGQSFQWGAFFAFAFIQSATPGPNVILLTSSGSTWGFKKTIPHLLGVCFGFPVMYFVTQMGASRMFEEYPWLFTVMTILSLLYVLWLSVKIINMGFGSGFSVTSSARPMTFSEAVLFQWINGKAWQMVLMAATLFPAQDIEGKAVGAMIFFLVLCIVVSLWVEIGKRMTLYLENKFFKRCYYLVLGTSLLLSTFPAGLTQLGLNIK